MSAFILRRFFSMLALLISISALVFYLMSFSPGNFLTELSLSKDVSKEFIQQETKRLGLDRPWHEQYLIWLNNVSFIKTGLLDFDSKATQDKDNDSFSNNNSDENRAIKENKLDKTKPLIYFGKPDFGYSWRYKISVGSLIWQRVPATLALAFASIFVSYFFGIILGVLAAAKKDSFFDKASSLLAYASFSIPYFFLALLAVYFAATTGVLPTGSQASISYEFLSPIEKLWDLILHLILPVGVLSIGSIGSVMRVMRANFIDYMRADFVTSAKAKGLPRYKILLKHILRNAINPIITSIGFSFAGLLSGALLVENVMNYPGLGQLIYTALMQKDQNVVLAATVISCSMLVLGQTLADILLALTDPRIKFEKEKIPYKHILIFIIIVIAIAFLYNCVLAKIAIFALCLKYIFWSIIAITFLAVILALLLGIYVFIKKFVKPIFKYKSGIIALTLLGIFYICSLFAGFLAPYSVSDQQRQKSFHPPTAIVFKDFNLYVKNYANVEPSIAKYEPIKDDLTKIIFFKRSYDYKLFGVFNTNIHLFGLENDSSRIYLLGSDSLGRDVFSRLLYGSQISLSIGFIGIAITLFMGFVVGSISGYYGKTIDFLSMRFVEFLMAIPSLYLLLTLRSALAENFSSNQMYIVIVLALSLIGWAPAARVIRGMSLSLSNQQFVLASKSMGQSSIKIIFKHFLPNLATYLLVSATLSIPAYILGEAALSFLGLGVQEPSASWGLMLSDVQKDIKILMLNFWWLLTPGVAIFICVLLFNILGDVLRDIVDPKQK